MLTWVLHFMPRVFIAEKTAIVEAHELNQILKIKTSIMTRSFLQNTNKL